MVKGEHVEWLRSEGNGDSYTSSLVFVVDGVCLIFFKTSRASPELRRYPPHRVAWQSATILSWACRAIPDYVENRR
jgi:hypothetical protein